MATDSLHIRDAGRRIRLAPPLVRLCRLPQCGRARRRDRSDLVPVLRPRRSHVLPAGRTGRQGRELCDLNVAPFGLDVLNCYLEDLFVDSYARGLGTGRALIDDLLELARKTGWSRVYWHTNDDNETAPRLYHRCTEANGFVRYRVALPG